MMPVAVELERLLAYALALLVLYLLVRTFAGPLRALLALVARLAVGGVAVWALDLVVAPWGLHLGVNPVTALVVGVLGVPGAGLLVALRLMGF